MRNILCESSVTVANSSPIESRWNTFLTVALPRPGKVTAVVALLLAFSICLPATPAQEAQKDPADKTEIRGEEKKPADKQHEEKKPKTPIEDLSFDQLMQLEVEEVFTASKWVQKVSEAPASVSVITSDEIRRYGYRTLAEILQNVRGFYTTYDQLYNFVGARGFLRPGDYNSRILVLIDGHRHNENVYGGASVGTDFPVDVDLIDRVEVIRGPSSSLYGTGAFFGVVNVITRRGRNFRGLDFSTEFASLGTNKTRLSYGTEFKNGVDMFLSTTFYHSTGHRRIYYKEFDSPATNNGVAEDSDRDRFQHFIAGLSYRDLSLKYVHSRRGKEIPNAGFGTVFNDDRNVGHDDFDLVNVQYDHTFANRMNVVARFDYDRYSYNGEYPYDLSETDEPFLVLNKDEARGEWLSGEFQLTTPLGKQHRLTAGTEYRYNRRQDQRNYDIDPFFEYLNDQRSTHNLGVYAQDEITLGDKVLVSAGIRHDRYPGFGGTTNPRLALIVTPVKTTTLKFLYGSAFRAPNPYESFFSGYGSTPNPDVRPEEIRTGEFVLEQYVGKNLRFAASAFTYRVNGIITEQVDLDDGFVSFINSGKIRSSGVEFEAEGKLKGGWHGRASYSFQAVKDQLTGARLINSPQHAAKLNLTAPLFRDRLFAAFTTQYLGDRDTKTGESAGSYALANMNVTTRNLLKHFDLSVGVYNLFNARYGDPVGDAYRQNVIEQDGRAFRAKLTFRFRADE